ncbi:cysteine protease StiP domain-containing protein [Brevundimonas sp.]|uniref:cysteine protease StiP domain-containing protein n=1 Tax=Brevundimonas sp. TaxID=1871086 RepID=UPI002FC6DC7B
MTAPKGTPGPGSYRTGDVSFLLKVITLDAVNVREKERLIQSGSRHYSEMISSESAPDREYMAIYADALRDNGLRFAQHINNLADALSERPIGPRGMALTSLARAGTPIGVLLTLALRQRGIPVDHYSISIIRDRGLDLNAMRHILERHDPSDVVFVDGWTGKGAIATELRGSQGAQAVGVDPFLVVVADPAGQADLAATGEDYLIPSGILNGIVSGLISRSILNDQIKKDDFHGCVILDDLRASDVSRAFVDTIALQLSTAPPQMDGLWSPVLATSLRLDCGALLATLANVFDIRDINRIKPGIAEATRAVLRRVPERLLIDDVSHPDVRHLVHLASTRRVPINSLPCPSAYRAVAIISHAGSD